MTLKSTRLDSNDSQVELRSLAQPLGFIQPGNKQAQTAWSNDEGATSRIPLPFQARQSPHLRPCEPSFAMFLIFFIMTIIDIPSRKTVFSSTARYMYNNNNPISFQYLQFMFNIVYFSINTYIYSFISLLSRVCLNKQENLMATFLIGMYLP